eukprot:CAMPEP_0198228952 /NCGR_PEP_ID=MMETSP1445-20131203/113869_1 /TAXON_ID=36898 /ORGANISM="Pyramimonas sp., Strain CCMP2087" /LENGTH=288 /DNA_ID=CAMNT_0043909389 /DNA_START=273 /DNA_END=1139 /DNA_ORIENTATION=+
MRHSNLRVEAAVSDYVLLVNDVAGKMGTAVAEAAQAKGVKVAPYSLTGPKREPKTVGDVTVEFFDMSCDRDAVMQRMKKEFPKLMVIDYTIPDCVNSNAELYIKHGVPFVMGTTGGDRVKLLADVEKAGLYAVIAPQMGKQVVAFQAAMKIMGDSFPGAFTGYTLKVTESHQSSKVDTSGTAKAIVASFQDMGVEFEESQIEMVRDPVEQVERMHVPEEHLLGHAYHTYQLTSPDGEVNFKFEHNVCGRGIYAQGTVDAALCLMAQMEAGSEKKLFNMIEVLKSGDMR